MITIAQRLRPFSHRPGCSCLIPGTPYEVEVFPALLRFYDLSQGQREQIDERVVDVRGPVKNFTVMQDLERGCVSVWGEDLHYHILPSLEIVKTKNPGIEKPQCQERLSLGSHKKQEWEEIRERSDFREIFPLWFRLGRLFTPEGKLKSKSGVFSLLEKGLPSFQKLFLAGFRSMLVPRLFDEEHQGILPTDQEIEEISPLFLLSEGSRIIRSLFIEQKKNTLKLLPHLPPEFFAGRMIHLDCGFGELDIEWTKKKVRRAVFRASQDQEVIFLWPSSLKQFRLRTSLKEKGQIILCGKGVEIKSGSTYVLDRFQR